MNPRFAVSLASLIATSALASNLHAQEPTATVTTQAPVDSPVPTPAMTPTSATTQEPTLSTTTPSSVRPPGITSPASRDTVGSAYTHEPGTFGSRLNLFGLGTNELIGHLGLSYTLPHRVQLSTNLLHMGAGLVNLQLKWQFLDTKNWALAGDVAPTWINGNWVWLVGGATKTALASIDVITLPLKLWMSWLPTRQFQFDLGAGYTHSWVFGSLDTNFITADTQLAVRQISLDPTLRIHVLDRLSFSVGGHMPVWTSVPGTVDAEVELGEGVVAGGSVGGYHEIPFKNLYSVAFDLRSQLTKKFFATFGLSYGPMAERLYNSRVYPHFGLEGRFK